MELGVDAGLLRFLVRAGFHRAQAAVVIVPAGLAAVKAFLRGVERHHVVRRRQIPTPRKKVLELAQPREPRFVRLALGRDAPDGDLALAWPQRAVGAQMGRCQVVEHQVGEHDDVPPPAQHPVGLYLVEIGVDIVGRRRQRRAPRRLDRSAQMHIWPFPR